MEETSQRYHVNKMGNLMSQEVDLRDNEGQGDPLTEAKTAQTKHKNDRDEDGEIQDVGNGATNDVQEQSGSGKVDTFVEVDIGDGNVENNNRGKRKSEKDEVEIKPDGSYELDHRKDDTIEVLDAGKDDVDAASTYSLFMAQKDFRYYFQHPYSRLIIAYLVVFCNFFIYAEDPVAHSRKECYIPMIGNDVAFILTRYPPNAWSLLKVVFWLIGLVIGLFVGKLLIHGRLFNKIFRLKMFSDDQGSWMVMFLISLISIFIMSLFYNLFLMIGGDNTLDYRISDLMGISNDFFMKVAACGTWCGDFFTAWMVTDIMLQEKLYPGWARPVRKWWRAGFHRIILFWIIVVITSFIVIFVIATDYIQWDLLNRDFMPTNEVARAFLASFILVMDLLIVMQDWDFPHFISPIDIKLPGLNTAHIRFQIPKFLKREHWNVHITGKWFNYGILFIVMLLDLNMWKNQIFFSPYDYGQYTNNEGRIYTVQDDYSLNTFNESQITFEYRSTNINPETNKTYVETDTHMNTKYLYTALGLKCLAFIPSVVAFIVFGILIWQFGRFKPTENNPYAGRLKKRIKKKRFSFRLSWKRRVEIKRKIKAVPKLLYFKSKGASGKRTAAEQEVPTEAFTDNNIEIAVEDKDVEP
ncbi:transmembrane protein 117-like isoform X2 [Mya arenaria]|nr:transmembrane protein 117-like isoform X2 [Mya arenaria]XP_052798507.1 transmembrane protein 117-like isoform X2 [Mya arenaria]XP_052798508.1 transmembrane protein 117-like isoform X2 [Mya arenaria]